MTILTANPGDNLTAMAGSLAPGDTLQMNDGLYTEGHGLQLSGKNGAAGAPITIKAVHDGKVTIDGGSVFSSTGSRGLVWADNCTNFTFDGFIVQNSNTGSAMQVDNSDFMFMRRLSLHGAAQGNWNSLGIGYCSGKSSANHNVVEDCLAYGQGRYCFQTFQSPGTTFRRCLAFSPSMTNVGFIAPRAGFSAYNESGSKFENCYFHHGYPVPGSEDAQTGNPMSGWYITTADTVNFPNFNTRLVGCISRNVWEIAVIYNHAIQSGHTMVDCYIDNPINLNTPVSPDGTLRGDGVVWDGSGANVTVNHSTFANNTAYGVDRHVGDVPMNVSNSVFDSNGTAVAGVTSDHNNYWNNSSNGIILAGTDTTLDPGFNVATYGHGGRLIRSAALGGKGCEILYQTVNGILTTTPLWPWPMEDRIFAETGWSPTFESHGGMWTTLTGLYSTSGPVISNVFTTVTGTLATTTWDTDIASDSHEDYGPTTLYGQTTP